MNFSLFIYKPISTSTIDFTEIKDYILNRFCGKIKVEVEESLLRDREEFAEDLARIRVMDISKVKLNWPLHVEIEYEKRSLKGKLLPEGILYDGFEFQELLFSLIGREKIGLDKIHVVITDRLIGTFDEDEKIYHARTNILGIPSITSLSGIVEAPAKPREFYLLKQRGIPTEILKERFKGRFIDYNDNRLTEVLKGYIMQSIFYQIFGEGFCENKNCRLFNAHWQEELINAQLNEVEFCKKHEKMLES